MKVFLLSPPVSLQPLKLFPRHPPLLSAQLAAVLRSMGHRVQVLDAFLLRLGAEDVVRTLLAAAPDAVVVLPNDVARETPPEVAAGLAAAYRAAGGKAPMWVAGVGNGKWLRDLLDLAPGLSGALVGDPEPALPELLAGGETPGLILPGAGTLPEPGVVESLDALPLPAWDLFDLRSYVVLPHRRGRGLEYPLLASRGCWWNRCLFCQDLACVKSSRYRVRSPEHVVEEMEWAAKRFRARHFLFHDAVFPARREWLARFADELEQRRLEVTWFCMTRADAVDAEVLRAMRKAGCRNVCFGLESGDDDMLRRMDKGHDTTASLRAVQEARDAGLEVSATFVLGFPGETPRQAGRTAEFAASLGLDYAQFLLVKWHQVPRDLLSAGTLVEEWDLAQYDYRGMVFVPDSYGSLARLKLARTYAYVRFYLRPAYLLRTTTKLRSKGDIRRYLAGAATLARAMLNR
ncbi:MAG: radical SAM protein [Deltaproteobacteria bacterium]|nr:radical SAM protein [Deltaproteobacteria bacterium]